MSRAIDGTKRKNRRVKILKLAKGFRGDRKSNYKPAKDAVTKALNHAMLIVMTKKVNSENCGLHVLTLQFEKKE